MEQYNVIANQPIVIDNGSGVIKAGFAGDEIPKCNFRNNVSRPKHSKIMAGALEGDTFIGQIAEDNRGKLIECAVEKSWNHNMLFYRFDGNKISNGTWDSNGLG